MSKRARQGLPRMPRLPDKLGRSAEAFREVEASKRDGSYCAEQRYAEDLPSFPLQLVAEQTSRMSPFLSFFLFSLTLVSLPLC
eukprot:7415454-Prorocentrum_lima.AAC.1